MGSRGRLLVQEDGQLVATGHFLANFARQGNGLFHRHALNRNKRHHIDGTHTRVLSLVVVQVDQFYCHADGFDDCLAQGFGFAHYGHYQAVVVFVVTIVKQFHTGTCTERSYNLVNLLQVASFAEVGDAFHNSVHIHYL